MRYYIYTLGCQMNYSDSERLSAVLESIGWQKTVMPTKAEAIFFNTCSIRQKAEDKVFGQMRYMAELKKANPKLLVGITGCMVKKSSTRQSAKKDHLLQKLEEIDLVFRIDDLAKLPGLLKECNNDLIFDESEATGSTLDNYFKINPRYSSPWQAFIPIMKGCDNFCAFCVVPFTRGREKSRAIWEIVDEAQELVNNGCLEITLLGQNVNSYGKSRLDHEGGLFKEVTKNPFVMLLEELNKLNGLKRLRFISPHPKDMDDETIEAITSLPKMCPYVHLPVQSGDNEVLRRMNRGYTRERYAGIIQKIRQRMPNAAISTDIIVGFPGETEEQFANTYRLFEEIQWDMSYTAQYSPRPGTLSQRLFNDDVPRAEKARRYHLLNDLLRAISYRKNREYTEKMVEVLVERSKGGRECSGRTDTFKTVAFAGGKELVGKFIKVKIKKAKEWILEGEAIETYKQEKKSLRSSILPARPLPVLS